MKIKLFLTACIAMFILGGCVKSDLSETLRASKKKGSLMVCSDIPCPTALFAQNLPPGQQVIVYRIDGTFISSFTTTDYTTLETNCTYRLYIPVGATVTYCSCGENYGVLTTPSNNLLHTSSDPTSYSTCSF